MQTISSSCGTLLKFVSQAEADTYNNALGQLTANTYKAQRELHGIWATNQNKFVPTANDLTELDSRFMEELAASYPDEQPKALPTHYQIITDTEIQDLFSNTRLGSDTDGNPKEQRKLLAESVRSKKERYWVGSTIFSILVAAGLINDNLKCAKTTLTRRGAKFLEQELGVIHVL